MKTIIHVNQKHIIYNSQGAKLPVISYHINGVEDNADEVIIFGQDGLEAARIVYSPEKPFNNGIKVWIETENKIEKITK